MSCLWVSTLWLQIRTYERRKEVLDFSFISCLFLSFASHELAHIPSGQKKNLFFFEFSRTLTNPTGDRVLGPGQDRPDHRPLENSGLFAAKSRSGVKKKSAPSVKSNRLDTRMWCERRTTLNSFLFFTNHPFHPIQSDRPTVRPTGQVSFL